MITKMESKDVTTIPTIRKQTLLKGVPFRNCRFKYPERLFHVPVHFPLYLVSYGRRKSVVVPFDTVDTRSTEADV